MNNHYAKLNDKVTKTLFVWCLMTHQPLWVISIRRYLTIHDLDGKSKLVINKMMIMSMKTVGVTDYTNSSILNGKNDQHPSKMRQELCCINIAPALGKIIKSHSSLKCREKRCMHEE